MRLLLLLLLVGVTVVQTDAQSAPPVDRNVRIEVSLANNQQEFHIGETIPLRLSFSSSLKDRYQVNMAQYDRSGRMSYEYFSVTPAEGAVDPLPTYHQGSMGGITNFQFLTPEPWTITLNLNEWVRFTRPGVYKLTVTSHRVGVRDSSNPFGTSPATVISSEITLKIIPADRLWQKRVFSEAVATLDARATVKPQEMEKYTASRRQAMETLRFLGTADAARELVKQMRGKDSGGLDYICMLGLISSPERAVARSALEEAIADPDHPIDSAFLYTLRTVLSDSTTANANWREDQQKVVEELLLALPNKRGEALSVSLSTTVNEVWNGTALPQQTMDKLVNELVSLFDQLPLNEQNSLLSYRWDKIKSPALLPLLRRYAESYRDFPEMRESNAFNSLQLSASALQHWYELDPAGARPAIIKEITRPRPRFSAHVLGILPDETLPEVDFALSEHFLASEDLDGSSNLASLIARYATAAILPQILERLDARIGRWACAIQSPILAYVLRVNPALARSRIEQAIAARGKDFTACNHGLFQGISTIHYDPVLEETGIHSLDDLDPEVAMTAATMLGQYGSPAAEEALWQRYASWCQRWAGHEKELDIVMGERLDDLNYQLGLGNNLVQALATGRSWLTDKTKLQRLAGMTKVRRLQQQLDNYLKVWEEESLTIFFDSTPNSFGARVAQYEFYSLGALKDKLAQFPSGTKFSISMSQGESSADDRSLAELRAFLSSHGMLVAGEKRAH